ncbi:MAG TPA: hypothetical protein V6D09_17930 [Leptolyngbyaceae cyanobacterium]
MLLRLRNPIRVLAPGAIAYFNGQTVYALKHLLSQYLIEQLKRAAIAMSVA